MEQIKNLEELSAYFYGLADGGIDPFDKMYGICYQVDELFERGIIEEDISESYYLNELFLDKYFESGDGYSGEPAYPVPSTNEIYTTAGEMFDSIVDNYGDMWTGAYGDLRKDLCLHIAKQLERLIEVN